MIPGSFRCLRKANVQNVIVEFSSPNIAKPFHVGNFRSTIIGNFIANIFALFGHNVIRLNYLGDWGTQFGLLSLGYDYFGDDDKLKSEALKHLLDVYVKSNAESCKNEEWKEQAKKRFQMLEQKQNLDVLRQWQSFRDLSISELKRLYARLGVEFDEFHSESMYSQASLEIVNQLKQLGFVRPEEDGALCATLSQADSKSARNKIPLVKRDGSSLYLTRDIAAAVHRKELYNFDKMYYVVDNSQTEHFNNLKDVLRESGKEWQENIIHVKFGRIQGMSTRKGEVVLLEDLLDEAKERALKSMLETPTTKVSGDNLKTVADVLGASAIIINDMKYRRTQNYKFDWDFALQQHGNSGIALQYAHARMCSLEANCGVTLDSDSTINYDAIDTVEGNDLLATLGQFDQALHNSLADLEPKFVVKYLFQLKDAINKANKKLSVKGQSEDIAKTRLLLFNCSRKVLNQGMRLLGLKPLDAM